MVRWLYEWDTFFCSHVEGAGAPLELATTTVSEKLKRGSVAERKTPGEPLWEVVTCVYIC